MSAIQHMGQTVSSCTDVFSKTKESHFRGFIRNTDYLPKEIYWCPKYVKEEKTLAGLLIKPSKSLHNTKIIFFHIVVNWNRWFYVKPGLKTIPNLSTFDKTLKWEKRSYSRFQRTELRLERKSDTNTGLSAAFLVSTDSLLDYSPFLQSEHSYTPKWLCDSNQATLCLPIEKK